MHSNVQTYCIMEHTLLYLGCPKEILREKTREELERVAGSWREWEGVRESCRVVERGVKSEKIEKSWKELRGFGRSWKDLRDEPYALWQKELLQGAVTIHSLRFQDFKFFSGIP